jgi:hypothetical protein
VQDRVAERQRAARTERNAMEHDRGIGQRHARAAQHRHAAGQQAGQGHGARPQCADHLGGAQQQLSRTPRPSAWRQRSKRTAAGYNRPMAMDSGRDRPGDRVTDVDAGALAMPAFAWHRRDGRSRVVLACEHASHFIPEAYAGLGLPEAERQRHIGWDLGAAPLALALSDALDAPLLLATYSRLLRDLNRAPDADDAVTTRSEGTDIPETSISPGRAPVREARIYAPFHAELDAALDARLARGSRRCW